MKHAKILKKTYIKFAYKLVKKSDILFLKNYLFT